MKEYSSKTYLKDVVDYEIKIYCKTNQYYFTIKKIINIKSPFIIKEMWHDIKLLDNNYYIMEYIPCGEKYFCRLFINEKKEIKEYYYQFTEEQGIENSIPFYIKTKIAYEKHSMVKKYIHQLILIYLTEN